MEGNLKQEDGTSQKVAVKTMKCEFLAWDLFFWGGRLPQCQVLLVEQWLCSILGHRWVSWCGNQCGSVVTSRKYRMNSLCTHALNILHAQNSIFTPTNSILIPLTLHYRVQLMVPEVRHESWRQRDLVLVSDPCGATSEN